MFTAVKPDKPVIVAKPLVTPDTPTLATLAPDPLAPVGTRCIKSTSQARVALSTPSQFQFAGVIYACAGCWPCGSPLLMVSHVETVVLPPTIRHSGNAAATPGCKSVR